MNVENQDQDFTRLQQLLKLKRFEKPHPRYFNSFAGQITDRIRAGERGGQMEGASSAPSWLERLWSVIEAKAAVPALAGVGICGLVLAGVFFTDHSTNPPLGQSNAVMPPAANSVASQPSSGLFADGNAKPAPQLASSNSLFSSPLQLEMVPVQGTQIKR